MKIEIFTKPVQFWTLSKLEKATDVIFYDTEFKPEYMESKFNGLTYGRISSVKPVIIYEE